MSAMETVKANLDKIAAALPPPIAAKLDDVAEQTSQPKAYFVGAALVLIALLTFLLLPPVFITSSVGVVYPCYGSLLAIESGDDAAKTQWLSYWLVYSMFGVCIAPVNFLFQELIPFWFYMKIAFLVWCMLPSTKGASKVYDMAKPKIMEVKEKLMGVGGKAD